MEFKDLPMWKQVYKIGFPEQYDENDTYEQAEFKKAYVMRDLVDNVVSNDIIPTITTKYNIGDGQRGFLSISTMHLCQTIGPGPHSYDTIINDDNKTNTINNFEFNYSASGSKYYARVPGSTFDRLSVYRIANYADYLTLMALKIDNLNRRLKVLEG